MKAKTINRNLRYQAGFTLIELLIGMVLMIMVLAAVFAVLQSSATGTSKLNSRSDAQREALNSIQLVSARMKEAWYIYPPSSVLNFPNNSLIVNPATGANAGTRKFVVGSEPVLAMIVPPISGSVCTPAQTDGCYRFYAYYGMTSAAWSAAATGFKNPGPALPNTWVVAEYRAFFMSKPIVAQGSAPPSVPTTAQDANLVAEDIVPALGGAAPNYQFFTLGTTTVSGPAGNQEGTWPLTYVNRVRQDLRVTQGTGSRKVILPSPSTTYQLNIYPENIGLNGI